MSVNSNSGSANALLPTTQLTSMRVASDLGQMKYQGRWNRIYVSSILGDAISGSIKPGVSGWCVVMRRPTLNPPLEELFELPLLPHFRAGIGPTRHLLRSFSLREDGRKWLSLTQESRKPSSRKPVPHYPFLTEADAIGSLASWLLPKDHVDWRIQQDGGLWNSVSKELRNLAHNMSTKLAEERAVSYFLGLVSIGSCVLPFYLDLETWSPREDGREQHWWASGLHFSHVDDQGDRHLGRQVLIPCKEANESMRFADLSDACEPYYFLSAESAYDAFRTAIADQGFLWIPGSSILASPVSELPSFPLRS